MSPPFMCFRRLLACVGVIEETIKHSLSNCCRIDIDTLVRFDATFVFMSKVSLSYISLLN